MKSNRFAAQDILEVGEYESIVITGQMNDGTCFGGGDWNRELKEA